MKRMLVISDTHCGHNVGLTPPEFQPQIHKDAPRAMLKQAAQREAHWNWFADTLKRIGKVDCCLLNGDAIEGKGLKSGGTELLTADREQQAEMAVYILETIDAPRLFMTYGTPRHVGEEEDWENRIARDAKAEKIEAEGHYDLAGLQIAAKHLIGNSNSPMSSMTAMRGAQVRQMLWAARDQQPRANLIIRSHIHRCYSILEPAMNFQGWVTPALQGLGSKFGTRQVDGLPVDFGLLLVEADSATSWNVTPFVAARALAAAEVLKI